MKTKNKQKQKKINKKGSDKIDGKQMEDLLRAKIYSNSFEYVDQEK